MSPIVTSDFLFRYQRTPGAKYHVRPLTLLQQEVLYCCDGTVTVADLADATKYTHPEIRAVVVFLSQHGLIKTLPPDPRLFAPPAAPAAAFASSVHGPDGRVLFAVKRKRSAWNGGLW